MWRNMDYELVGKTFKNAGWFLVILTLIWIVGLALLRYFESIWRKVANKAPEQINHILTGHLWKSAPYMWTIIAVYLSLYTVGAPQIYQEISMRILFIVAGIGVVYVASRVIEVIIYKSIVTSKNDAEAKTLAIFLTRLAEVVVAILVGLLVMQNLGIQISALLGGLGVGGIAIAFAAQNIMSDLFGYFIIYFDKPFRVGDFVSVGVDKGTVYRIGLRSTRLKALTGDEMVIPNRDITSARVGNYQRVTERRGILKIGISPKTKALVLSKIPDLIKEKLSTIPEISVERVHWVAFAANSFGYEIVYVVKSGNYELFMDTQQVVNLAIKEMLEKEKIELG